MHGSWRDATMVGMAAVAGFVALPGCGLPFGSPEDLVAAAEQVQLFGQDANVLALYRADVPDDAYDDFFSVGFEGQAIPEPTFEVVLIDLDSLTTQVLAESASQDELYGPSPSAELAAFQRYGGEVLADGDWTVRVEFGPGERAFLRVDNERSGEETAYLEGLEPWDYPVLLYLDAGRLIVSVSNERGGSMVVIDLDRGTVQTFSHAVSSWRESVAVEDDRMAFLALSQSSDEGDFENSFGPPSIDLVDLATGARETIVAATADVFPSRLQFIGNDLLWDTISAGATRVMALDMDTRATRTLVEIQNSREEGVFTNIAGFNATAALVSRTTDVRSPASLFDLSNFEQKVEAIIRFYDGREVTLLERTITLATIAAGNTFDALTDDFATAWDGMSGELIVYELATGSVRRVAPFDR